MPGRRLLACLCATLALAACALSSCARPERTVPAGARRETSPSATTTEPVSRLRGFATVRFAPDPVEPDGDLVVSTMGSADRVTLLVPGSSTSRGPLPGAAFWQGHGERLELTLGATGQWEATCVAPSEPGFYPVRLLVEVDGTTTELAEPSWALRVYPDGFLARPAFEAPEDAIRASLEESYPGVRVEAVERRDLLPEDRRDTAYNRLYLATFSLPRATAVLSAGRHSEYFYVLKDGPEGDWRVLMSGSGP